MYAMRFGKDEESKKRYEACVQAIILSDPRNGGKVITQDEWNDVISLLIKLKSVGHPSEQIVNGRQLYELHPKGGEFPLSTAEHTQMLAFLRQPMWHPEALETIRATVKYVESLRPLATPAKVGRRLKLVPKKKR